MKWQRTIPGLGIGENNGANGFFLSEKFDAWENNSSRNGYWEKHSFEADSNGNLVGDSLNEAASRQGVGADDLRRQTNERLGEQNNTPDGPIAIEEISREGASFINAVLTGFKALLKAAGKGLPVFGALTLFVSALSEAAEAAEAENNDSSEPNAEMLAVVEFSFEAAAELVISATGLALSAIAGAATGGAAFGVSLSTSLFVSNQASVVARAIAQDAYAAHTEFFNNAVGSIAAAYQDFVDDGEALLEAAINVFEAALQVAYENVFGNEGWFGSAGPIFGENGLISFLIPSESGSSERPDGVWDVAGLSSPVSGTDKNDALVHIAGWGDVAGLGGDDVLIGDRSNHIAKGEKLEPELESRLLALEDEFLTLDGGEGEDWIVGGNAEIWGGEYEGSADGERDTFLIGSGTAWIFGTPGSPPLTAHIH